MKNKKTWYQALADHHIPLLTYRELFDAYERMGVEYGVMIDVFRDSAATINSAAEALEEYAPYRDKFKLVV